MEQTREAYLERYVEALRAGLFAEACFDVPPVRVSAGFPATGGLGARKRRLGECWPSEASDDAAPQIFVNPTLPASEVGHVLVHELLHACMPKAKHGKAFAAAATKLGLEGKPTATTASEALRTRLNAMEESLGSNPWAMLTHVPKEKKQATRLLKAQCACDRIIRVTASVYSEAQIVCRACGEAFKVEGIDPPNDDGDGEESSLVTSLDDGITEHAPTDDVERASIDGASEASEDLSEASDSSPSLGIPAESEPEIPSDNEAIDEFSSVEDVEAIARKRAMEAIERVCVPLQEPEITLLPSGSRIIRKHRILERAIDV